MLKISHNQIEKFNQYHRNQFIEKMLTYIQSHSCINAEKFHEKELKKDISDLINKAMSYGYTKQNDIYYFIEIILMCGVNFEKEPKYQELVSNLNKNKEGRLVPIKQLYHFIKRKRM